MNRKRISYIIGVYCLFLLLLLFKMLYYAYETQGFLDEDAHVGYVIYLEESKKIIPDYPKMHQYYLIKSDGTYNYYQEAEDTINYLGHPPLYYHLMRLIANVQNENGYIKVNIFAMRVANMVLIIVSFMILYYVCFTRFLRKNAGIFVHIIIGAASLAVPMIAYVGAGVSNDNLSFLGMVLLFVGILRYYEKRVNLVTYGLVGIGFMISILTKLTVGEMAVIVLILVFCFDLFRKKGLKIFLNKFFAITSIFYIIPIIYFLIIYFRYHAFQPSLQILNYDYYKTTGFYVEQNARVSFSFWEYLKYYWKNFIYTWVAIYGPNDWTYKYESYIGWIGPLMVIIFPIIQMIRCFVYKSSKRGLYLTFFGGALFTAITQFVLAYRTYLEAGYSGGYQARYYLCLIPFLVYGSGELWCDLEKNYSSILKRKKSVQACKMIISVAICILLIYGDFLYFLLHYNLG